MGKLNRKKDKHIIKFKKINDFISLRIIREDITIKKRESKSEYFYEKGIRIEININNEPIIRIPNTSFPSFEKAIHEMNQSWSPQRIIVSDNKSIKVFHCLVQNLTTWCENNYDTKLLHYKIAFPLLRKLKEIGETKFQIIFQQEILWSYMERNLHVKNFLESERYLKLIGEFF
jgi:hypothetical protein